jgi:hypothetical protein
VILPAIDKAPRAPARNKHDESDFVSAWPLLTVLPIFVQALFGVRDVPPDTSNASPKTTAFGLLVSKVDVLLDNVRASVHNTSFQADFLLALIPCGQHCPRRTIFFLTSACCVMGPAVSAARQDLLYRWYKKLSDRMLVDFVFQLRTGGHDP